MAKIFTYGYDVNAYIDEALKRLRECHSWVTLEHFRPDYSYAVEKKGRKHVFVSYFKHDDGSIERRIFEGDGEAFVKEIVNQWYVVIMVGNRELFAEARQQTAVNVLICFVIFALIAFFYLIGHRNEQNYSRRIEEMRAE